MVDWPPLGISAKQFAEVRLLRLLQLQLSLFPQISLPPEPILHCRFQFFQRNPRSDFQHTISRRQSVVKNLVIGEVAHGKAIQPLDGTGLALARFFIFDFDFAGVHGGWEKPDPSQKLLRMTAALPDARKERSFRHWRRPCLADRLGNCELFKILGEALS